MIWGWLAGAFDCPRCDAYVDLDDADMAASAFECPTCKRKVKFMAV